MQAAPMLALGSQALGSFAEGRAAMAQGRAERNMARSNAFISETRAIQTGTTATQDLASQLAEMRSAFAANGQGTAGTGAFFQELRRVRQREARIEMANERQQASDWRMRGDNAMVQARAARTSAYFRAGKSLFDMGQLQMGPR